MDSTKWISKKIALLGSHAVGKTSLISRFVYGKFPESYLSTIGLKVDKKTIDIQGYRIDLVIWDIAGQDDVSQIPSFYLNGCSGIIWVADLSRPATYQGISQQIASLEKMIPNVDIVVVGNKFDLLEEAQLDQVKAEFDYKPDLFTSAKTGFQVEDMFNLLSSKLILSHESKGA